MGRGNRTAGARVIDETYFGTESIWRILKRTAPPVMFSQLVHALYNIVDSFFVGQYSGAALTAVSVVFPIQLIIIALAVGTGVGVNTYMARMYALRDNDSADRTAGTGEVLAVVSWMLFSIVAVSIMRPFVMTSTNTPETIEYAVTYGNIVCAGSLGLFMESIWSKVHQAGGNMKLPMIAQVVGALVNVALDPLFIFGWGPVPQMGIAGAAWATVVGQVAAAAIVGVKGVRRLPKITELWKYARHIYGLGYPHMVMNSLYTVYIMVLNMILAGFCDEAVTVLGLYYKLQAFCFIPLSGLQTCIVPVISYNFAIRQYDRCIRMMNASMLISAAFMVVGMTGFEFFPRQLIGLFAKEEKVFEIGVIAFRIIGTSFFSAVFSLMLPTFFQAIGSSTTSVLLAFTRQIFCLMPIFWLCSLIGLNYSWLAFPLSETIAGGVGLTLYLKKLRSWKAELQTA